MRFAVLAEYLRTNSDEIVRRWADDATRDPAQPACRMHLSGSDLIDHLPDLLQMLARTLVEEETSAVERDGAEHGHQRRAIGYTVTELLDEMSLFRRHVMDAVDEHYTQSELDYAELSIARRQLLDLIDRSVHASVARFNQEAEGERDAAHAVIAQKNAELHEANAQKDHFLTMLSHELRNPLSSIMSAVQVLQRAGAGEDHLVRQRSIIDRQVRHLAKLVDDLLDVNRVSRGKIDLQKEVIDVHDALTVAIEIVRPAIENAGHQLHVEHAPQPVCVEADATRLAQVLTNLLANAAKYTPPGGRIDVSVAAEGSDAVMRVRDNGIGIAPEMLPKVFELFAQADTSLHRQSGGLGVGLMVAKNLIEMQGGRIEGRSDGLGHGAEFLVRLPLVDTHGARCRPIAAALAPAPRSTAPRRIALVEDNPDARDALGTALELLGHEVFAVASPDAALDVAREQAPEVFIIDIGLPGMSGYDLARALRGIRQTTHATLIALTGYGSDVDRARADSAGFDFHVTKPADIDKLHALLSVGGGNAH